MAIRLVCFATAKAEELSRSDRELHALAVRAFSLARSVSLPDITPCRANPDAINDAIQKDLSITKFPGGDHPAQVVDSRKTEENHPCIAVLDRSNQNGTDETLSMSSCKRTRLNDSLQAPLLSDLAQPAGFVQRGDLPLSKMPIDNLFRLIPQLDPVLTLSSASQCVSLGIAAPATCGQPASVADPAQANRQPSHKRVQGLCAVNLSNGSWRAMLRTDAPTAAGKLFHPENAAPAVLLDGVLPSSHADKVRSSSIFSHQQHQGARKRERNGQRLDLQQFSQRGWTTWQTEQLQGRWGHGPKSQRHRSYHRNHSHNYHHDNHQERRILQERKRAPMYANQKQFGMVPLEADTMCEMRLEDKWRYSGKKQRLQEPVAATGQWRATCSSRVAWDQPWKWRLPDETPKQQRTQQQQSQEQQRAVPHCAAVTQQPELRNGPNGTPQHLGQGLDAPTSGMAGMRTSESTAACAEREGRNWPLPPKSTSSASAKGQPHGSIDMGAEDAAAPAAMGAPGWSSAARAEAAGEGTNSAAIPEASADPSKVQLPAFAVCMADGYGWQQEQKLQKQQQQLQGSGARQHSLPPLPPPPPPPLPQLEQKTAAQASKNLDLARDDCCRGHEAVFVKAPHDSGCDRPQPAATPHGGGCGGGSGAAAVTTEEQARTDSTQDVESSLKQVHKQKDKQKGRQRGKRKARGNEKAVTEVVAADSGGSVGAVDAAANADRIGKTDDATSCGRKAHKKGVKKRVKTPTRPAPSPRTLDVPVDKRSRHRERNQQAGSPSNTPLTRSRMAAAQRVDSPTAKTGCGMSVGTAGHVEHKDFCRASAAAPAAEKANPVMADAREKAVEVPIVKVMAESTSVSSAAAGTMQEQAAAPPSTPSQSRAAAVNARKPDVEMRDVVAEGGKVAPVWDKAEEEMNPFRHSTTSVTEPGSHGSPMTRLSEPCSPHGVGTANVAVRRRSQRTASASVAGSFSETKPASPGEPCLGRTRGRNARASGPGAASEATTTTTTPAATAAVATASAAAVTLGSPTTAKTKRHLVSPKEHLASSDDAARVRASVPEPVGSGEAATAAAVATGTTRSHSGPSPGKINVAGDRNQSAANGPNADGGAPHTDSCVSDFGIQTTEAALGAAATAATAEHVRPQQEPAPGPCHLQKHGREFQAHFTAQVPPIAASTQPAGRAAPSLARGSAPGPTAAPLDGKPERRYRPVAPARRPRAAASNLPSTHAELAAVAAALLASQLVAGFNEGSAGNAAHGTAVGVTAAATDATASPSTVMDEAVPEVMMSDAAGQEDDTAAAVPREANRPTGSGAVRRPSPDPVAMPSNTPHCCRDAAAELPSRAPSISDGSYSVHSNISNRDTPHGCREAGGIAEGHQAGTCSTVTDSWASHPDTGAAAEPGAGVVKASRGPQHPAVGSNIGGYPSQRWPFSDTATSPIRQAVPEVYMAPCPAAKPSEGTAAAAMAAAAAGIAAEPEFKSGLWHTASACGMGEDGDGELSRRNSCACESHGEYRVRVPEGDGGNASGNNEGMGSHGAGDGRFEGPAGAAAARESNGGDGAGQGQEEEDAGMSEVEREEWRRRRAEIERQRAEAAAEREAARRARAARAVSSATEELERRIRQRLADHHQLASAAAAEAAAKEDIRSRIRDNLQERFRKALEEHNLSRMLRQLGLLAKGTYLRTAEQRSKALKSAKIRFHPDKVTGSLEDRVYAEEVSKLLNSWTWTK
ncbi:hypothetical protein Vretimale_18535 [Volvox reticuliferus]|uniref:J domain-containing protein n=1 Tax=Volvox reticuliferus TaxID=1737510 RepID=A0A8J4GV48_9CHLO|nr:hypothetical protein Vretifemale_19662 [Volvox reticuliferus]GIM15832.1 hypothetical protein Vretimale_18535 [Volvox reticuliferus]